LSSRTASASARLRQQRSGAAFFPLTRSRAPERLPKKEFALFERSEFANSRQHRGVPHAGHKLRASRLRRDKGHRVPFLWFVSLGKQRNEHTGVAGLHFRKSAMFFRTWCTIIQKGN
jgi:hypothetical protein